MHVLDIILLIFCAISTFAICFAAYFLYSLHKEFTELNKELDEKHYKAVFKKNEKV